jgi:hypothetical protein
MFTASTSFLLTRPAAKRTNLPLEGGLAQGERSPAFGKMIKAAGTRNDVGR